MEKEPQRVQYGERMFLMGLFAVVGVETVTTIVTASKWFEFSSLLLGLVGFVGALIFANELYAGKGSALFGLRILICVLLGLMALGLVLLLAGADKPARLLGVNVVWLTCVKMAVYGLFAGVLFSPGYFVDFLAARRGETIERVPPTGPALDLPADQAQTLGSVVTFMRASGAVMLLAGAIELLLGLQSTAAAPAKSLLDLIGGFAALCLGAMIITTAGRFRIFLNAADRNTGHLAQTLASLGTYFKAQIVLGLIIGVVIICRMVLFIV